MTCLLDVNVLIALAWPSHVHHRAAQLWFGRNRRSGWATCPVTQIGFVRISSNPKFIDGAVTPGAARRLLRQATRAEDHQFWPDDLDFLGDDVLPASHLLGHRQVTDAYLLGLAINHGGKLATMDNGIAALLPDGKARSTHLELIGTA